MVVGCWGGEIGEPKTECPQPERRDASTLLCGYNSWLASKYNGSTAIRSDVNPSKSVSTVLCIRL